MNERLFEDTVVFERFLTVLRGKPSELIRELINHHYQLAIHALEELHLSNDSFVFLKNLTDLLLH